MAFQARHRWMIQRLDQGFGINDELMIESFLRDESVLEHMNSFFSADGPSRIMFYYQPRITLNERDEEVEEGPPILFATTGEEVKLKGRAIYFVRKRIEGVKVALDLTRTNDGKISYGTIDDSPLKSFQSLLSRLYKPLLDAQDDWGKASGDHRAEFRFGMDGFINNLADTLKSLNSGLELRKPDVGLDLNDSRNFTRVSTEAVYVNQFIDLLDEWCRQTGTYLDDSDRARWESNDAGPDTGGVEHPRCPAICC
jgi:dynein heavy chain